MTTTDALLGPDKLLDLTQPLGMLPAGLWHLEGLTRLERVPARGAWLVAAALPVVEASGAPARAFAILP